MINILPESRWHELRDIFTTQFEDSDLPTEQQSLIVAETDDVTDDIRSFVVLEQLWRIGQVFSAGGNPRKLFSYVESGIQSGSIIGIASDPRFETLFRKFKMHRVPGTLFRRDF